LLSAFCIVVIVAFALYAFFAGVTLKLENRSGRQAHNVKIDYGQGTFFTSIVPDKGIQEKSLGKIGEGANFVVQWQHSSDIIYKVQFNVYFEGHSGYTSIKIRILPNGEALLYDGEIQYRPFSASISNPYATTLKQHQN